MRSTISFLKIRCPSRWCLLTCHSHNQLTQDRPANPSYAIIHRTNLPKIIESVLDPNPHGTTPTIIHSQSKSQRSCPGRHDLLIFGHTPIDFAMSHDPRASQVSGGYAIFSATVQVPRASNGARRSHEPQSLQRPHASIPRHARG
jgi:hypothetical protein